MALATLGPLMLQATFSRTRTCRLSADSCSVIKLPVILSDKRGALSDHRGIAVLVSSPIAALAFNPFRALLYPFSCVPYVHRRPSGADAGLFSGESGRIQVSYTEVESVQKAWTFRHWIYSGRATYHWR